MNKKKIIFILSCIVTFFILWRISSSYKYVTFEYIKQQRDYLKDTVNNHYAFAVVSYIFSYIFIVVCAIPVTAIMTIIGGAFFGPAIGCVYAVISATVGATISFFLVRYFFGMSLQKKYETSLISFNEHIQKYGTQYLLLVHFIPAVPFFVINILAGLTKVDAFSFIWTTLIGIIPASFLYAYGGSKLTTIQSPADLMSKQILLGFLMLAFLALIPIMYKRIHSHAKTIEN